MGIAGTDVAKMAAGVIMANDSLSNIIDTLLQG